MSLTVTDINQYLSGNNNGMIWDEELCKRVNDPKCIEKYGYKVYSQNDEDGIIEEIFTRIGTTDKRFIEFGVQNGIESNGHYLLLKGWTGFWIECDDENYNQLTVKFKNVIESGALRIAKEFITKDNINDIFRNNGQSGEVDLLSIDIDGNDYHVWEAITEVRPRVIVIEYNSKIPPTCEWVMPYCAEQRWDGGDKHGASLLALESLGKRLGYTLVGTNISGVNAFFVRDDCVEDKFSRKSAKLLYNPPRFYKKFYVGHPSLYCLKDLPEGRKQVFSGTTDNIIYTSGFYCQEMPESSARWMSERRATLLVADLGNSISKIRFCFENPSILSEAGPRTLKIQYEQDGFIAKDMNKNTDTIELEILRDKCHNDGVIEVTMEIDGMWCPLEAGTGEDNRNLGLMLREIACL